MGGREEFKKWKAIQAPKTQLQEKTTAKEQTSTWWSLLNELLGISNNIYSFNIKNKLKCTVKYSFGAHSLRYVDPREIKASNIP